MYGVTVDTKAMASRAQDICAQMHKEIFNDPSSKNGFALIVANPSPVAEGQPYLQGAMVDLTNMTQTFRRLQFSVSSFVDLSALEIKQVIRFLAGQRYPYPYKRLAFVYAGHGDEEGLLTKSGKVSMTEIICPLQPNPSSHLAFVAKLVFIDACRGTEVDQGVRVQCRGPRPDPVRILPSLGNTLLAHATLPAMRSYETNGGGGFWMSTLAEKLRTERRSVLDVLTVVNKHLVMSPNQYSVPGRAEKHVCVQQPVLESTLNEPVCLLEEADQKLMSIHGAGVVLPPQQVLSPPSPSTPRVLDDPPATTVTPHSRLPVRAPTAAAHVPVTNGSNSTPLLLAPSSKPRPPSQPSASAAHTAVNNCSENSHAASADLSSVKKRFYQEELSRQCLDRGLGVPRIVAKQTPRRVYVATAFVKSIGCVKGGECESKAKAMEDVARKALEELKQQ